MLFGSHRMKVHRDYLKYSIVDFKSDLSYIKREKFLGSLYRSIKHIDKTKNTVLVCDDPLLKDKLVEICRGNKRMNYLAGKWPSGLLSNPVLLKQSVNVANNIKKQLQETTNKKTQNILQNQLHDLEKIIEGFKGTDNIKQVIYIGSLSKNIIMECRGIRLIATVGTECGFTNISNPIFCNDQNYFTKLKILELIEKWIKKR